jgi:hypothetical protein
MEAATFYPSSRRLTRFFPPRDGAAQNAAIFMTQIRQDLAKSLYL